MSRPALRRNAGLVRELGGDVVRRQERKKTKSIPSSAPIWPIQKTNIQRVIRASDARISPRPGEQQRLRTCRSAINDGSNPEEGGQGPQQYLSKDGASTERAVLTGHTDHYQPSNSPPSNQSQSR